MTDGGLCGWTSALLSDAVDLTQTPDVRTPIAFGREVCLPTRALGELTREELQAVIAHEVAHVQRRDDRWLSLALAVERLFVIQPLNRWALRELRTLGELACDDWARSILGDGRSLAAALAKVARWVQAAPTARNVAALAGSCNEGMVLRRVRRLLLEHAPTSVVSLQTQPRTRVAVTALLLVASSTLPSATPRTSDARADVVTIRATDPAGQFTITLLHGRALAASVGGVALRPEHIRQTDRYVVLTPPRGGPAFTLAVSPGGDGVNWKPRRADRRSQP